MLANAQGSFGRTLGFSLVYGFAGLNVVARLNHDENAIHANLLLYGFDATLGALCGFFIASAIHEFAHFLTARLLGGYVRRVRIGTGMLLLTFEFMGTRWEINESLRSGVVMYFLTSPSKAKLKLAAITAAAPLASTALAGLVIAFLFYARPSFEGVGPSGLYLYSFFAGFAAPCVLFLTGVLLPYRYQNAGRTMETDALRLLTLPKMSKDQITKMVEAGRSTQNMDEYLDVESRTLEQALLRAIAAPKDMRALNTVIYYARKAEDPRTIDYFRRLLALPLKSGCRSEFIDELLSYCLESDLIKENGQEMESLSEELVRSNSANVSFIGTRGAVLIDLGRIEEGKAMLQGVLAETQSPIDKTYSNIFLALAAKAEGDLDAARTHAATAAKLQPENAAFKRVAGLLPAKN